MKSIIISILLFFTAILPDDQAVAQINWYVSNTSSGNGNGSSWVNKSLLSSFNWSQVQAGDIVYVDGGSNGLTYGNLHPTKSGSAGNPITITRGVDAGHNGVPTFTTTSYRSGLFDYNYLTISYLNFTATTLGGNGLEVVAISGDYVTFQYNTIIHPHLKAVRIDEANGVKILHNTFDTGTSNPSGGQPDGIWLGNNGRNLEIAYNQILMRNSDPSSSAHKDCIQSYGWQANATGGLTKIHHNFFYSASATTTSNTIFELGGIGGDWQLYNNIVVYGGQGSGRVLSMQSCDEEAPYDGYPFSAQIYNNTFIIVDPTYFGIMINTSDTLIFKNNIVYNPNGLYNCLLIGEETTAGYIDFDYNQYMEGTNGSWLYHWDCDDNATGYSFSEWRSMFGQDAHSENFTNTTSISFVGSSLRSTNPEDYELTASSSGVNEGTNTVSGIVTDDYEGTSRPQGGTYDVGAFEFNDGSSNNINVKSKIFLQGPFSTNSMLTTLTQSSLLPNSQPYNSPPWNYNGNESFSSGPSATMVDWVLVELRSASNPVQIIARRAAVLKNNGLLLETNGVEGITFNNVDPGSYYIVIYHRNHLAIMSAAPVPLSSNSVLYDFTTAMNKAYGQNPMVQLAAGKYGMYATDGNADGVVNNVDRDDVWLIQNGNMGYLEGDFNMNSGVTVHDVNQLWNLNDGKITQVP